MNDMDNWVPHRGTMSWLSRVLSADAERLVAEAEVTADHLLLRDGALSPTAGVEYMAQAVAAWAGALHKAQGGTPKIGFLLGTRRYSCTRAAFHPGDTLQIRVQRQFQADNGLGQFECEIWIGDARVAVASLNVFGPDNPEAFLRGETPT